MKTIKIIDLLNKIANREEVPEKIKYRGEFYIKNHEGLDYYVNEENYKLFLERIDDTNNLLEKIEIIEEEKEIEKLDYKVEQLDNPSHNESLLMNMIRENKETINKLIDAVNELKKDK